MKVYFSQFCRLGRPRSRHQQIWCRLGAIFLVDRHLFTVSLHSERGEGAFWGPFFIRALIPFTKAPSSWPSHLLKSPPPNTITLSVRITIYELWGDINIHSIVHSFKIYLITISLFITKYIIGRSFSNETHLTPHFFPVVIRSYLK